MKLVVMLLISVSSYGMQEPCIMKPSPFKFMKEIKDTIKRQDKVITRKLS